MPRNWLHPHEQLTHGQHGPAENMTVLTYAYSKDTKRREVMDWVIPYGKGRVYTTMLGHLWKDGPDTAMRCVGFQTVFIRGVEWAATGKESEVTGAMEPTPKAEPSASIHRLRITLADVEPPVWRVVEVADCSLGELHDVIQVAMGWQNSHMHQFVLNGKYYGQDTSGDLDVEDEDDIRLSQIFTGRKKPRIVYEYDFGDSWRHESVLRRCWCQSPRSSTPGASREPGRARPRTAAVRGATPTSSKRSADPKHAEHRDMKEWIGGKFDPEKFSVEAVNKELRRAF